MTVVEEEQFMKHWNAVRKSWDDYFEKHGDTEFVSSKDFRIDEFDGWEKSTAENSVQVRYDFELASKEIEDKATEDAIAGVIVEALLHDICDVAENGDTDNVNNPTLKIADGRKKHGKTLEGLDIIETFGFKEWSARKDATEYTFYLAFNYVWA